MDLPKNEFKAAIMAGRQQLGLWCTFADTGIAELAAGCGYDWLMFDTEHSPIDPLTVMPLLQAAAPYPVSPVVRPGALDPIQIKKLLDFGAQNILVPYIQSAEEAALAVASVTYPPEGIRGVAGGTRATRYGAVADYHRRAREEICIIVQIETKEALDALDEIAAVPGLDAVFIGPSDLAASLGHLGDPGHPEVKEACFDAIRRLRAAGKPAGFLSVDQQFVGEVIEAGSIFTAVDTDAALLRRSAVARVGEWRKKLG